MKKITYNPFKRDIFKVIQVKTLQNTKWLNFKKAIYRIKGNKKEFQWDYIERNAKNPVVTILCRSIHTKKYLLVCQPRIPLQKYVIEFPAGLVDKGESYTQAALRELKEETGYNGKNVKIFKILPNLPKSAGLTNETTALVECLVDEKAIGTTKFDETEQIKHIWVSAAQFYSLYKNLNQKRYCVSHEVVAYFMGILAGRRE